MAPTEKSAFDLPPEQSDYIDRLVSAGTYASANDVISAGLNALRTARSIYSESSSALTHLLAQIDDVCTNADPTRENEPERLRMPRYSRDARQDARLYGTRFYSHAVI